MCAASGVGAVIDAARMPVSDDLRRAFPDDWTDLALAGGEDYELVFAAPSKTVANAQDALDTPVTVVGRVVEGEGVEVVGATATRAVNGGWDHFRSRTQ